jgi:hypothetical protein
MKRKLLFILASAGLLSFPKISFGQAPTLGTSAKYALFTSGGAVGNTGISHVTGNLGTSVGAITGFGNVDGVLNAANASATLCASDLLVAYNQLNATVATAGHAAVLGNAEILTAGIYSIAAAGSAAATLSLDAQGNPNAVFIFKIGGAFTTAAATKVYLINGALACNVFWKVEGAISLAAGTIMKGTLIANNAAASIATGCKLEGRMFSTLGAVAIDGSLVYLPLGCSTPSLTGPASPSLASAACYALFSSNGAVTNTALTTVTGDIGTNVGLTTGFITSNVIGNIHAIPDVSTGNCATDLSTTYNYLNALPSDIELLFPAQLGNKLVLTPHTYTLNAATALADTLFLNAQNNANAVFVISVNGALTVNTSAKVVLLNGALSKNVYWLVKGNVTLSNDSKFIGTIVSNNGIDLQPGVNLDGRALTTNGALTTNSISATKPSTCATTSTITGIQSHNLNEAIAIYPNPFNSLITIDLSNVSNLGSAQLNIYNVIGELVITKSLTNKLSTIETTDIASGFYFYKVFNDGKLLNSGRLISQK